MTQRSKIHNFDPKDAPVRSGFQRSHRIPVEVANDDFFQLWNGLPSTRRELLSFSDWGANGQYLPNSSADGRALAPDISVHTGSHPKFTSVIREQLVLMNAARR